MDKAKLYCYVDETGQDIAGFIREYMEGASYAQDLYRIGVKNGVIKQL